LLKIIRIEFCINVVKVFYSRGKIWTCVRKVKAKAAVLYYVFLKMNLRPLGKEMGFRIKLNDFYVFKFSRTKNVLWNNKLKFIWETNLIKIGNGVLGNTLYPC